MFRIKRDTGGVASIELRDYAIEDLLQVLVLCEGEGWTTYTEDSARSHRVFTAPGVVAVVAELDSSRVGFAYLQTDGEVQAHLSQIVVSPDHRRRGIARDLLSYAVKRVGARRIDLITDTSQDFYRSLDHKEQFGFRIYPDLG
jgi:ribosomal protein S18 acetylase RimI-like enzyme